MAVFIFLAVFIGKARMLKNISTLINVRFQKEI